MFAGHNSKDLHKTRINPATHIRIIVRRDKLTVIESGDFEAVIGIVTGDTGQRTHMDGPLNRKYPAFTNG